MDLVISKIGRTSTDDFSESEYVNAVVDNSYWSEAGPFVVYLVIKAVSVFHSVYYVVLYFVGERAYILGLLAPILLWQSKAVNS